MYRRRRSQREKIFFSFDSFLDVVANVIGIIIRLILVAWVGARTYTAAMQLTDEEPPPEPPAAVAALPPPTAADDPLHGKLALARLELDEARDQLLDKLHNLEGAQEKTRRTRAELDALARKNQEIERVQGELEKDLAAKGKKVELASLSLDGLRKRGQELTEQIKTLQNLPPRRKELKYHAPVSRAVQGDEMFFECRGGRVAFIDMPAFLHEIDEATEGMAELLRKEYKVSRVTSTVGAFRLHYFYERERGLLESATNFRYGLGGWMVEPVNANRGETLQAALAPTSEFHRIADAIDPNQTVVTFWVYQDSFEIFRGLRDYLYEHDVEVAGRPLPMEAPIAASRNGTKSLRAVERVNASATAPDRHFKIAPPFGASVLRLKQFILKPLRSAKRASRQLAQGHPPLTPLEFDLPRHGQRTFFSRKSRLLLSPNRASAMR